MRKIELLQIIGMAKLILIILHQQEQKLYIYILHGILKH